MTEQAAPGVWVTLQYEVRDAEGELVAEETVERLVGYGQLLPAIERGVEGLEVGGRRTITLRPEEAFGRRDPKAIIDVSREDFPDDVAPGDRFEAEDAEGRPVLLSVLDVDEERVVLDQNHPLAGQRVEVRLAVVGSRLATEQELEQAAAALSSGLAPTPGLIAPETLLRGGRQRYETDSAAVSGDTTLAGGSAAAQDLEAIDDAN